MLRVPFCVALMSWRRSASPISADESEREIETEADVVILVVAVDTLRAFVCGNSAA